MYNYDIGCIIKCITGMPVAYHRIGRDIAVGEANLLGSQMGGLLACPNYYIRLCPLTLPAIHGNQGT